MTSDRPSPRPVTRAGRLSRRTAVGRAGIGLAAAVAGSAGLVAAVGAQDATPQGEVGAAGYLVVRKYQLQPGASFDELVRRVEEGFVPIISGVPGFVDYYIVDTGDGGQISVSVFADQAGADESTQRAAGWVEQNLLDLVQTPPEVTAGTVRLRAVGGSAAGTPVP